MERIGRYEIVRWLGDGGAGRVYEAVLVGPGGFRKPVALKLLRDGGASILREARLGGLLRHRNLVDVYEVGEVDGVPFIALELCVGSLTDHAPLPPRAVVDVGLAVCEALAYAHDELGLVHQDIKPDNLLIGVDAEVKVADLGIARAHGFEDDRGIRGTPAYMAPEQAAGGRVDARADVYALGRTLAELARGGRLGASETVDDAPWEDPGDTSVLEGPTPWEVGAPPWLQETVARCTHDDPDLRWPDMAALARALGRLVVPGPGLREHLADRIPARPKPRSDAGAWMSEGAFVGRRGELSRIADVLAAPGVAALQGAPGVGKSRLAARAASEWQAGVNSSRPVWWVDLEEARDTADVLQRVALAMELTLQGDEVSQLGHALAAAGVSLLVLDGADGVADLLAIVERWVGRATELRVLVTARASVGLRNVVVDPMPDPDALELLVRRAAERGASVGTDADAIALVHALEGVPLAIELAAGRIGVLSVSDVVARLGPSMLRRATLGRHATIEAALEASWVVLSPREQSALTQLSVFSGGFALEQVERVLELGDASVMDVVEALMARSLVRAATGGRLSLFRSVQAFAADRAVDPASAEARHGIAYAALLPEAAWDDLDGPRGPGLVAVLVREAENLSVACRRAVGRGDADIALRCWRALQPVITRRGPLGLGLTLGDAVIAMPGLTPLRRVQALTMQASLLQLTARAHEAVSLLDAAEEIAQRIGDRAAFASALATRGGGSYLAGRTQEALAFLEQSLAVSRELGDPLREAGLRGSIAMIGHELGGGVELVPAFETTCATLRQLGAMGMLARTYCNFGNLLRDVGEMDRAIVILEAAMAAHEAVGDRQGVAGAKCNLGIVHQQQGRADQALALYEASVATYKEAGNRRTQGLVFGNIASIHLDRGHLALARVVLEEALAIAREVGNRRGEAMILNNLGSCGVEDDPLRAISLFDEAITTARGCGQRRTEVLASKNRGEAMSSLGRTAEAEVSLEEALAWAGELGDPFLVALCEAGLGDLQLLVGRPVQAEHSIARALDVFRALGRRQQESMTLGLRAEVRLEHGDRAQARLDLAEALAIRVQIGDVHGADNVRRSWAEVELRAGEPDQARALLADLSAPGGGTVLARASLARCRSRLADAAGNREEAAAWLEEARGCVRAFGASPSSRAARLCAELADHLAR